MKRPAGRKASIRSRVGSVDWGRVAGELDEQGWSRLGRLLTDGECRALVRDYAADDAFRSTVDMARHQFGRGQYRYFGYPLPRVVGELRAALYDRLVGVANQWTMRMRGIAPYPPTLRDYLEVCHGAGQKRPTPLVLRYGAGDYNCLHQDLYGPLAFPLQVVIALCEAGRDYDGGEVIFVEQRPRAQSRASAVVPRRGEAVVFTNRERPARGSRGDYRVQMRHGASVVTRGSRFMLGVIFHDAA
jgi:uncharacterized protein